MTAAGLTTCYASRQCDHVNYVNKNDGSIANSLNPNSAAEDEYLFSPYATFTVTNATFEPAPTESNPHVVTLLAAVNNQDEPDHLPSGPWL